MRAVVYSRVSTDAQERDGTSLDTQERACLDQAADRGWNVVRCIRDAASGATLEREGIAELRAVLRSGEADVIVAYAVDRLSRNQNHIGVLFDEFERAEVRMEFVTERFEDTAVGRFILAARAFIAEVEREKIAERTMRGKAERARGGRIPQAFGAGCYGYTYNPATGKREVEPFQATVVRRIFERYGETRSVAGIANELNDAGIPAFSGGPWYPITIRRMLAYEAYVGRTVYRRTKRVPVRAPGARRKSRVIDQPREDWIEIPDATPAIIELPLWERVQQILADPERAKRRPVARRHYLLRGRLRCSFCQSAMVGQTLSSKGRHYPYYRCRHAYSSTSGRQCAGRYVPAELLEDGVLAEIRRILSAPEIVLHEQRRLHRREIDDTEVKQLQAQIALLRKGEGQLVRLAGFEDIDTEMVRAELADLHRQREALEAELGSLTRPTPGDTAIDEAALKHTCARIAERLEKDSEHGREQTLEALQISAEATREVVTVEGVLPIEFSDFIAEKVGLSPLNKHRHDDALMRKGMRAFSHGARALTPSNELVRGQPRCHGSLATTPLVAPQLGIATGAFRDVNRRRFRFGWLHESP